ncbi:MAG: hypothetical protein QOJ35_1854 [Solirubrobacteraceae bacterium]|jgi:hypothetical protein|nr:hypothetical protein [Solirubrobacteraceae bacterium]
MSDPDRRVAACTLGWLSKTRSGRHAVTMPITTTPRTSLRNAAIAASSIAIGLTALSSSNAGAAGDAAAARSSPGSAVTAASDYAPIPYLTVLPPEIVRHNGRVMHGRIRLRAIVGASGLETQWSIRIVGRHGDHTDPRVIAHGTVAPTEEAKPVSAVAFGKPRSVVRYDVTATNSAGGQPAPVMRATIA